MGRPTDYTPEIGAVICERLAEGQSLKAICEGEDMPARSTVYLWRLRHTDFSDMYARAREDQADTMADEILAVADDEGIAADSRRVRVDARKWIAAKLKPRVYSEKLQHGGDPDGVPVSMSVTWVKPSD